MNCLRNAGYALALGFLWLWASPAARSAQLEIGTRGERSSTFDIFEFVLVVDGNGISERRTGFLGGSSGSTTAVTLPEGSGYRVRMITPGVVFGGRADDITVTEPGPNLVMLEMSRTVLTRVSSPASAAAGTAFSLVYDIVDPSGFFDDATDAWLWGVSGGLDFGYMADDFSYSTALAKTTVQKLGSNSYRLNFENVPGLPGAGTATFRIAVPSAPFFPPAASFFATRPPFDAYGINLNDQSVVFHSPAQGVTLSVNGSPPGAPLRVVVDGTGFALRVSGSSPLQIGLPPGQGYRIRYFTETGGRLTSGRVENVAVAAGAFTPISGSLTAWAVTPDPANPTHVAAGQSYSLAFNIVDAGHLFERPQDLLLGSLRDVLPNRNPTGGASPTELLATGPDTFRATFTSLAAASPQTSEFELVGVPRAWWYSTNNSFFFYLPNRLRGDTPLQVVIIEATTGLDITVQGVPADVKDLIVRIDGPLFVRQNIENPTGGVAKLRIGLRPGAGYKVRVMATGGAQLPRAMVAGGVVENVEVSAGVMAPIVVNLAPTTLVSAADNPSTVGPNQPYTLRFALTLPAGLVDPATPIGIRRSDTFPPRSNGVGDRFNPAAQTVAGGAYSLSYALMSPNEPRTTTLAHQLELDLGSFDLPGIFPRLYAPNFGRGEPFVTVSVVVPPVAPGITIQPAGSIVAPGTNVVLLASAVGTPRPTLEWRKDGVRMGQSTTTFSELGTTLLLQNVQPADAGEYTLVATNDSGVATSQPARVTVSPDVPSNPARLANLSVRGHSGAGARTLIAGFVVGGAGTAGGKPLLIRAAGPSLARFEVPNLLADPTLAVFAGDAPLVTNDNWGGDEAIKALAARLGAFAFASDASFDAAALLPALAPRNYSAQVLGARGASGVALLEVYDAGAAFNATTPRLVNLSARSQMAAAGDTLIAGFVIAGGAAKRLLIRAVGPGLFQHSVAGTMANPKMDLFFGGTKISSNDDWGGSDALAAVAASVGAFPIGRVSRDAALLVTLGAGAYSVQVSGAQGSTGNRAAGDLRSGIALARRDTAAGGDGENRPTLSAR